MALNDFPFLENRLRLGMHAFAPLPAPDDVDVHSTETIVPSPLVLERYLALHAVGEVDPSRYGLRHRCGDAGQSWPNSHYHDTVYSLMLDNVKDGRTYPMAVCGFTPVDPDMLLICQLQALPRTAPSDYAARALRLDGGALLSAIHFERLLVHAIGDWALVHGASKLLIRPANENRYYAHPPVVVVPNSDEVTVHTPTAVPEPTPHLSVMEQRKNALLRVRYDGTARALRFKKPTVAFPYWSRDLSTWRLTEGWTPRQRS